MNGYRAPTTSGGRSQHVLRPLHDHARQHGRERGAAVDPARPRGHAVESLRVDVNAYVLTFAALILIGGKLADRFGRSRIFLVGLAIFTLVVRAPARSRRPTPADPGARRPGRRRGADEPALALDHRRRVPAHELATAIGIWAGISGARARDRPAARRVPGRARELVGGLLDQRPGRRDRRGRHALRRRTSRATDTPRRFDLPGTALVTGGLFALV